MMYFMMCYTSLWELFVWIFNTQLLMSKSGLIIVQYFGISNWFCMYEMFSFTLNERHDLMQLLIFHPLNNHLQSASLWFYLPHLWCRYQNKLEIVDRRSPRHLCELGEQQTPWFSDSFLIYLENQESVDLE